MSEEFRRLVSENQGAGFKVASVRARLNPSPLLNFSPRRVFACIMQFLGSRSQAGLLEGGSVGPQGDAKVGVQRPLVEESLESPRSIYPRAQESDLATDPWWWCSGGQAHTHPPSLVVVFWG